MISKLGDKVEKNKKELNTTINEMEKAGNKLKVDA